MPESADLHAAYDAFFQGDVDRALESFHPDVVAYDAPELPDTGTFHGKQELGDRLRGFHELFEQLERKNLTFEEIGDQVLVVLHASGRARVGEMPVEIEVAHLLRVTDGLVTEMRVFLSEAAARECVS